MEEDIKDFKQAFVLVLKMCGFLLASGVIIATTACIGFKTVSFIIRLFGI